MKEENIRVHRQLSTWMMALINVKGAKRTFPSLCVVGDAATLGDNYFDFADMKPVIKHKNWIVIL